MQLNYEKAAAYINRQISSELLSPFIRSRPLEYFLIGKDASSMQSLANPKVSTMIGGGFSVDDPRRTSISGSRVHEFRFQAAQTDAAETIQNAGETPVATGFAEDNMKTAGTKWWQFSNPLKVRESTIMDARSPTEVASVLKEAIGQGFQMHSEKLHDELWNGSFDLTTQTNSDDRWPGLLGIRHALSDGTESGYKAYGGYDRSLAANMFLRSNTFDAAYLVSNGYIEDTQVKLRLIRQGNHIHGPAQKSDGGFDLAITTPELWEQLADEADNKATIYRNGIPDYAMSGFKYPVIHHDNCYITYDYKCAAGEMVCLKLSSWAVEFKADQKFKFEGWKKNQEITEGGRRYSWGNIVTTMRMTCREPWLQLRYTGLTTSGS